jgi:ADP-ribose pyrophosphatase
MDSGDRRNVELLKRRLVAENSVFRIYFDHIEGANGDSVPDFLVVHPKIRTNGDITGVSVLPITADGRLGLLRIYRHAVESELWEIPRGFLNAGESEVAAAMRELTEETGLRCAESDMRLLGSVMPEAGVIRGRNRVYAALRCVRVAPYQPREMGHAEFRLFTPEECHQLIVSERLQDPSSILAYYRSMELDR